MLLVSMILISASMLLLGLPSDTFIIIMVIDDILSFPEFLLHKGIRCDFIIVVTGFESSECFILAESHRCDLIYLLL